jgi:hypothetical protein
MLLLIFQVRDVLDLLAASDGDGSAFAMCNHLQDESRLCNLHWMVLGQRRSPKGVTEFQRFKHTLSSV